MMAKDEKKELLSDLREVADVDFISTLKMISPSKMLSVLENIKIEDYSLNEWVDAYDFLTGTQTTSTDRYQIASQLIDFYLLVCRMILYNQQGCSDQ